MTVMSANAERDFARIRDVLADAIDTATAGEREFRGRDPDRSAAFAARRAKLLSQSVAYRNAVSAYRRSVLSVSDAEAQLAGATSEANRAAAGLTALTSVLQSLSAVIQILGRLPNLFG